MQHTSLLSTAKCKLKQTAPSRNPVKKPSSQMCHEKYSKERFTPDEGKDRSVESRVTLPFLGMVHCGFKEQKMWCVSHWQRKMVSYTIFSYRSKPLFNLASSPARLLCNLLSSATLLPPPVQLDSNAFKAEDTLGGEGLGVCGMCMSCIMSQKQFYTFKLFI